MTKEPLQQALDALTRLSFLGNGDFPGNSEGNLIARKAVLDIKQALAQQEQPAQEAVAYELEAVKFANGKKLVYQKPENLASYIKVRTLVYADADPAPTQPAQEPDPVLCKFYQVTTFEELVSAQEHHINKLQAKLEKENDNGMGSILARKSRAASDQWSGCAVVGCVASESQTGQVAKVRQEQPASVDAYVGAREDAAIWKKRALEAEELNRKFIAELNGPTYLGEPAQPAQKPVGRFVKATYGDYGVLAWHPSYVAKIGDCLYTHPAPTQQAQKPDLWKTQFLTDVMTSAGLLMYGRTDKKLAQRIADGSARWRTELYTRPAPTQPALSDDEILNCFYASKSEGMASYMLAVGRAIEAHCRGGQA